MSDAIENAVEMVFEYLDPQFDYEWSAVYVYGDIGENPGENSRDLEKCVLESFGSSLGRGEFEAIFGKEVLDAVEEYAREHFETYCPETE